MHYYKRNIGDYAKKAGRLSMLQHGSYTLLIDACYDREKFPTLEEAIEWTWASTTEEIEAVTFVLRKFFVLENGVYVQSRIQQEVAEYIGKAEINKRIAIERETKRAENRTKRDEACKSGDEPPPNHKPLTINQEPIKIKTARSAIHFKTFLENCKANNEKPISSYKPVFDYADKAGISHDMVGLCWSEFYRKFDVGGTGETKKYADWRKAFRNCVESNWFKLWWDNPATGKVELTSSGRTADKVAA